MGLTCKVRHLSLKNESERSNLTGLTYAFRNQDLSEPAPKLKGSLKLTVSARSNGEPYRAFRLLGHISYF